MDMDSQSQPGCVPAATTDGPEPSALGALLARVEAAQGADRVLDFELHIALAADEIWPTTDRRGRVTNPNSRMSDYLTTYRDVINADDQDFDFPRYTASIDAALSLVERVLPGWEFGAYVHRTGYTKIELNRWQDVAPEFAFACSSAQGPTFALALLAALLKALAASTAGPIGGPTHRLEASKLPSTESEGR